MPKGIYTRKKLAWNKGNGRQIKCITCGKMFPCSISQEKARNRVNCSRKCRAVWWSSIHPNLDPHRTLYYRAHKEEYRARNKKWIEANKEKYRAWIREWSKSPWQKVAHALQESKRRAMARGNSYDNSINDDSLNELLIKQNYKCNGCEKEAPKFQIDHIFPVAKGGKHTISNIQLLCKSCNCSKNDSLNWSYA
jgi:5-methylcytosine-specific restriction endonuclease McrA